MQILGLEGENTRLSLPTFGTHNSITECAVFSLEVFYLAEDNLVEPPNVFSVPSLPVKKDSIPRQEDVMKFPDLCDIQILTIDSKSGLLIGCDVPKALEPHEVRLSKGQGPFATKTVIGWTVNGPLAIMRGAPPSANFIRVNKELREQVRMFCNLELCDSIQTCNVEGRHTCTNHYKGINLFEGGTLRDSLARRDDVACLPSN